MKFYKLALHFSPILYDRGTWNFFCILSNMDTLCKPNFFCKFSSHFSRKLCERGTWNLVCIEYPYGLIYKTKFQVSRWRSIEQKCDANLKLSSHFCRKLCDRGTWNLVCIEYPYGLIYKKNFKFLGGTALEKNAILTCKISKLFIRTIVQLWIFLSYHHIFLENCATEEHHFDKIFTESQAFKNHSEQLNICPECHFWDWKLTFIQDLKMLKKWLKSEISLMTAVMKNFIF